MAAARQSQVYSADETPVAVKPKLSQEYDGYYVPEEPFSKTEDYLKFNAFLIGLKLAQTYEFSDECMNTVVDGLDGDAYLTNNITLHDKEMEEGLQTSFFPVVLNVTGLVAGPVADFFPNCYQFVNSVKDVEQARYTTFDNNIGEFFLAFLFNQMGNALNFQTKFERIEEYEENQNYEGVWNEYGDLIYLIWTFQPLEDASLAVTNLEGYVEKWLHDHEWLNDETPAHESALLKSTVYALASGAHGLGETVGNSQGAFEQFKQGFMSQARVEQPQVGFTTDDGTGLMNGLIEGIVDVFPYESNPQRCRSNFTEGYSAFDRMFLQGQTWDLLDSTFQNNFVTDLSYLLKFPFGSLYSCWWGFSTIIWKGDPYEDGVLTEDEELELLITIGNDIFTNLFFNAGYIYADVVAILDLTEATTLDYNRLGIYSGDILIRFIWRKRFTRNFEYSMADVEVDV